MVINSNSVVFYDTINANNYDRHQIWWNLEQKGWMHHACIKITGFALNLIMLSNCTQPQDLELMVFKQVSLWAKKSIWGFLPTTLKKKLLSSYCLSFNTFVCIVLEHWCSLSNYEIIAIFGLFIVSRRG